MHLDQSGRGPVKISGQRIGPHWETHEVKRTRGESHACPRPRATVQVLYTTLKPSRTNGLKRFPFINMSQMTVAQMSITETTTSPQHKLHWLAEQAPCVSPFSKARLTRLIGYFVVSARCPDFRISASVMPHRPSGGSMYKAYARIRSETRR